MAGSQLANAWFLELWKLAPMPEDAQRLDEEALTTLLKRYRIRRINAAQLLRQLRQPAMQIAPGTVAAAVAQIGVAVEQLILINQLLADKSNASWKTSTTRKNRPLSMPRSCALCRAWDRACWQHC